MLRACHNGFEKDPESSTLMEEKKRSRGGKSEIIYEGPSLTGYPPPWQQSRRVTQRRAENETAENLRATNGKLLLPAVRVRSERGLERAAHEMRSGSELRDAAQET